MGIERKKLSTLDPRTLYGLRGEYDRLGRTIKFMDANGDVTFQVDADNIFDADGNRFEDDLA